MNGAPAEIVRIERREDIAVLALDLPRRRNALNEQLCRELLRVLTELEDDRAIRALVLTGGAHFSAGGDLADIDPQVLEVRRAMQVAHRMISALVSGHLPVVAAVEGSAYGAGFSLAMACDFVVADENTRFCAAFGKLNLAPDYGLLWTLPQRVGSGLVREIVMLCEPIPGRTAKDWGLVDRLAMPGEVLETAIALARRLARQPAGSLSAIRGMLARRPQSLDTMLAWEADIQALLTKSPDFREAVRAFAEKRPPRFTNV